MYAVIQRGVVTEVRRPANGHTWSFAYDLLNRLTSETDPLNRVTSYTYDGLGNLKTKTDAKNQTVTYAYQVRRLTTITYPNSSTDTFSYDTLGRRTGMSNANGTFTYAYDSLNRPTSVTNQRFGATISYTYDAAGNRSKMTTPKGDVTYIYDGKNRLTQITDPVFGQFGFAYDPMDRRTSLTYPNGITTNYQYDRAYRLTAMVAKDGPGNVLDAWSYTYDRVGNRLSKTNKDGQAEMYQYDPVYRLTRAIYANGVTEAFAYDPVGNRLSKTDGSAATSYTYDVANQMLTGGGDTYTYDPNGSVISKLTAGGALTTFTYDFQNRLTQITGPQGNERSQYAPDGTRVDIYGSTVDTQYNPGEVGPQYDTIGNPILDMGNDRLVWVYRLYGPGIAEPLAEWRRVNAQTTFLHKDALGSITAVSNPQGGVSYRITYNAFGERSQTAPPSGIVPTRLSYTARENSVGSLMQYRSRHYETATGRFLIQDSYRGQDSTPPSLHRYTYTLNNPVRYTDPTGHLSLTLTGLVFLAVGLWNTYNFISYFLGEIKWALNNTDGDILATVLEYALFFAIEMLILSAILVYFHMGWVLLGSGAPSLAYAPDWLRVANQVKNLSNLTRAGLSNEYWSFFILAGCVNLLAPLLRSQTFSPARQAASLAFCIMGVTGILRARRFA